MTDRELLEAAAKAAGMSIYFDDVGQCCKHQPCDQLSTWLWNPLTDDGDALRLAVAHGFISPGRWPDAGLIALDQWGEDGGKVDWCAATRRAIVRAAAEMGK